MNRIALVIAFIVASAGAHAAGARPDPRQLREAFDPQASSCARVPCVQFFQAGLIHAGHAKRAPRLAA